jgi:hypothetical protein
MANIRLVAAFSYDSGSGRPKDRKKEGTGMKYLAFTMILAGALSAVDAPQTFNDVITDTMCGAKHNMKGHSDVDCVKLCAKGSAQYALFDGENVLKLSDQKIPAKFAAQRVKVTGMLDPKNKIIKVISIEPLETK